MGSVSEERSERPATLLWWDLITAAGLLVMTVVVLASAAQKPQLTTWLSLASLVAVGLVYLALGREALRGGMNERPMNVTSMVFIVLLVLLVGFASAQLATLASLQALAYPMIWVAADRYGWAVAFSGALAISTGIGSALAYLRQNEISPWVAVVVAAVSFAFAVAMGTWISRIAEQGVAYRRLAERLRDTQKQVAELSAQAGATAERERISRELHDTLTQTLTGLVMLSEQAQRAMAADNTALAEERLARVTDASREAMAEARALVATTQPMGDGGLVQSITRVADRLRLDTGLELSCELEDFSLDRELEVVLLRAAQEGLANARKHAKASSVRVKLATHDGSAVLRVEDDGVGPSDFAGQTGFGLSGLTERLRLVGGTLSFEAGSVSGSVLEVRVPWASEVSA